MLTKETAFNLFIDKCDEYDLQATWSFYKRYLCLDIRSIKDISQQFSIVDTDWTVFAQSAEDCIMVVDFNMDSKFMSSSSLYTDLISRIKIPIAFSLWPNSAIREKNQAVFYNGRIKVLTTVDEVNTWFARLPAEILHWHKQQEMCKNAIKYIKDVGSQYIRIMRKNRVGTAVYKTAYDEYQKLFLSQMRKITKCDEIWCESLNFA